MIENSERGITLAKPLAWTILTALIVGGVWIGAQIGALEEVVRRLDRTDARVTALETRQTAAEREAAIIATRMEAILRVVERTDARVARMEIDAAERRRAPATP
jgi:hypothetical protein